MKKILILSLLTAAMPDLKAQSIAYPQTRKVEVTENYHGTRVSDPYRWLEDDTAASVGEWVDNQNAVTDQFISKIPFVSKIKERLEKLYNFPRYTMPTRVGEFLFFRKNDGLQNQSVIFRQRGISGSPEVFIDPNSLSRDGTVTAELAGYSLDKKWMAVTISRSGSDWQELEVYEVETGKKQSDKIEWVKFSGASWAKDGFFYSRYDKPTDGKAFSNKNEFHKIYFHKLGTPQNADKLVYSDLNHPLRYFGSSVSRDGKYLFVTGSEGTSGNDLRVKNLLLPNSEFVLLFQGFNFNYNLVDVIDDKAYVLTDEGAPNYKLIRIDLKNPKIRSLILPETRDLLQSVSTCGKNIFADYLKNVSTEVKQYDLSGTEIRTIQLPGIGSAGGFYGEPEDKTCFFSFTSFNFPTTIFSYDITSGKSEIYRKPEINFEPSQFEVKQEWYPSKDGTKIPMFVVHKKGLNLNGQNPTLLYGYGGFNISLTPGFNVNILPFLENGGVYAMANLRGGGEFGESWHKAGMLEKKQNVFDDFISGAEFLIKTGYTSKEKLAIEGGSNGGLLVGACLAQRPDLFKVAFPGVGVLDMLRFHKFTIGWGWVVEYGSSDTAAHFPFLYKYSPLHNLKKGTPYPATLVTTADHDDRVVPAHSFKFIATLQECQTGPNPTLIRISRKAGHGAGKPISKVLEEVAIKWGFMLYNMGLEYSPK